MGLMTRSRALVQRLTVVLVALAALAACSPTCGGSASNQPAHSSSGATNGTYPQNITINGFFSGHFTSGFASCVKSPEAFLGYVQDSKPGSALRFDFRIPIAAYHGPGTYGPADGNPILGTVYMAGQVTWTAKSGTFTVNPGEKTGSVQMHLEAGPSFKPEDISGSWRCG